MRERAGTVRELRGTLGPMTTPANVKSLETGSGIAWSEWVPWLDARGAAELDHPAIAHLVLERIEQTGRSRSPEWWAQGVTVAYEQHIGRRAPGQRCTGDFSATVSKTLPGTMDEVLARWVAACEPLDAFDGVPLDGAPRTSRTDKWRYWRASLDDGTALSVNIQQKPSGDRSICSVNHDKLPEATDVDRWKTFWKGFLADLATR